MRVVRTAGALLLLALASGCSAELLLVFSIQRHGARNVLSKTSTLKESDAAGGPTLLPEGQRQAYNVGMAFRQRYLNGTACAANDTCLDASLGEAGPLYGAVGSDGATFNNFNTHVRSSSLARTIMTARSFLDGVFPPINQPTETRYLPDREQVVPVYSLPEDGNALIRGYTACPAYDRRLVDWFASEEFQQKAEATQALRDSVAAAAPGLDTSLENWWNVYDGFNVYRTYGVGTPMPGEEAVDNATFAQMQELANWLETSKMRSSLTGSLLSGLMLADVLSYLSAAEAAVSSNLISPVYYKLVHVSGHYNTQLGLLGALGLDQHAAAAELVWFRKIPSLAALLAFELHRGSSASSPAELAVRLVMQDGPSAVYTTIPLPCAQPGDSAEALAGEGACTLEAFHTYAWPRTINSTDEWCDFCENSSMTMCQLRAATVKLEAAGVVGSTEGGSSSSSSTGLDAGAVAGIAVACAAVAALLSGIVVALYCRRSRRQLEQAQLAHSQGPAGLSLAA